MIIVFNNPINSLKMADAEICFFKDYKLLLSLTQDKEVIKDYIN